MNEQESEKKLEAKMTAEVKKRGGLAIKLTSQFDRGLPDRLYLLPHHTMVFVEFKSTGKTTSEIQDQKIHKIVDLKFPVRIIDSTEGIEELLGILDARIAKKIQEHNEYIARVTRK